MINKFNETQRILEQIGNFQEYKDKKEFASTKEQTLYDDIFEYLKHLTLFIFIRESNNFKTDMINYYMKKFQKSEDEIKKELNTILEEKTELNTKYKNFRENRNCAAHSRQALFLTWDEFMNIELHGCTDKLNIAELGEKLLLQVDSQLREELSK